MVARFDTVKMNTKGPNVVWRNCMTALIACSLRRAPVTRFDLSEYHTLSFQSPARWERASMPPEMFLALNPFCSRMRVA